MKILFAALLAFAAIQACRAADQVRVTAKSVGLDEEETAIVNGFLELVQGVVKAGGDIDKMSGTLANIKTRVEKKLRDNGARYLDKLAKTLTNVYISEDNVNALVNSINNMAVKDGVSIPSKSSGSSRSKRSPKKKFKGKGKGKKGKKGCGK
ncbi:uncharacterized protein LOC117646816 [Thrips palmi]|uniref:Uncharacterized protein LOC117646816 n=1 Tax=Thrips palmi TaxID=161013 RepID=A0A6P8ZPD9_THRPL|nr:uncharacterized protein LOC117646816 [Thrips palmi]